MQIQEAAVWHKNQLHRDKQTEVMHLYVSTAKLLQKISNLERLLYQV